MAQQNNVRVIPQTTLEDHIETLVNDTSNNRWTLTQIRSAIQAALDICGRRILAPYIYDISGGFVSGTYEYAVPDYVEGYMVVEHKRIVGVWGYDDGDTSTRIWESIPTWDLYNDGSGGREIRMQYNPYTTDGRILYWTVNGPIPTAASLPQTSGSHTAAVTTITLGSEVQVGRNGYIRIEDEWIEYHGTLAEGGNTTLLNCVRGVFGTTANSHSDSTDVEWGIAVHDESLFQQIVNLAIAQMHLMYLNASSALERTHHMDAVRLYLQLADEFWRGYQPPVQGQMRLSRQAVGPIVGEIGFVYDAT